MRGRPVSLEDCYVYAFTWITAVLCKQKEHWRWTLFDTNIIAPYSHRQKCLRKTFLTIFSQCLDRFRSFFHFSKSQYYFLNVIFYVFFCFDIPKMFRERFCMREWEEMYSKWYLPRNSTDLKSAALVCIFICLQLIFKIFLKYVYSRYKGFVFKVQKWLQPLFLGE